jgi:hypothetical protein
MADIFLTFVMADIVLVLPDTFLTFARGVILSGALRSRRICVFFPRLKDV